MQGLGPYLFQWQLSNLNSMVNMSVGETLHLHPQILGRIPGILLGQGKNIEMESLLSICENTWNAPEMISLQLTMIKRYLSMLDIATYPKQFPSNHRRTCFSPSNHGSTLFSPSSTVIERHNPVTIKSPLLLLKAISAVFGHSVYLRFRDTTTNNALTTIGVVSTMSSAWSHEEKWCVSWGLGTWCYLSTSTNL